MDLSEMNQISSDEAEQQLRENGKIPPNTLIHGGLSLKDWDISFAEHVEVGRGTVIDGDLILSGLASPGITLSNCRVKGDVHLTEIQGKVGPGDFNLSDAIIRGDLLIAEGDVSGELDGYRMRVEGNMRIISVSSIRDLRFGDATIGGYLQVCPSSPIENIDFSGLTGPAFIVASNKEQAELLHWAAPNTRITFGVLAPGDTERVYD